MSSKLIDISGWYLLGFDSESDISSQLVSKYLNSTLNNAHAFVSLPTGKVEEANANQISNLTIDGNNTSSFTNGDITLCLSKPTDPFGNFSNNDWAEVPIDVDLSINIGAWCLLDVTPEVVDSTIFILNKSSNNIQINVSSAYLSSTDFKYLNFVQLYFNSATGAAAEAKLGNGNVVSGLNNAGNSDDGTFFTVINDSKANQGFWGDDSYSILYTADAFKFRQLTEVNNVLVLTNIISGIPTPTRIKIGLENSFDSPSENMITKDSSVTPADFTINSM